MGNDATERIIGVDEILFTPVVVEGEQIAAESDDDDDVPIATTLIARPKKTKRKKPTMWTYETVAEPTGIASKYWDVAAPPERATKRVAKQRLSDLHDADVSEVTDAAVVETTHQLDLPTVVDNLTPEKISKTKSAKKTKITKRTPIQRRCELQSFMAEQRLNDVAAVGAAPKPVVAELVVAGLQQGTKERTTKVKGASPKIQQKGTLIPRGSCLQSLSVPLPCLLRTAQEETLPPADHEALGTLVAKQFEGTTAFVQCLHLSLTFIVLMHHYRVRYF